MNFSKSTRKKHFEFSYLGLFILIALIIGGGTRAGLVEDFILQLLALPFLFRLFTTLPEGKEGKAFLAIGALIVLLPFLQALPSFGTIGRPSIGTVDAGRTLSSGLVALVYLAVFRETMTLTPGAQQRLVPFILLGVFLNFIPSFFQFGSRDFISSLQPFSFKISAGFFANENHLALLFVICVPLVIVALRKTRFPLLSVPLILLLILFQLVVGSRAGIMMLLAATAASYVIIVTRSWLVAGVVTLAGAALVVYAVANIDTVADFDATGDFNRLAFAKNTFAAYMDNFPFGTGLGTFEVIYPRYGIRTGVFEKYVNHAHNDYVELLLEGGVFAVALFAVYVATVVFMVARNAKNLSDLQKAALLAIVFVALHSIVDYPLRTMAHGVVFAFLNGVLFCVPARQDK